MCARKLRLLRRAALVAGAEGVQAGLADAAHPLVGGERLDARAAPRRGRPAGAPRWGAAPRWPPRRGARAATASAPARRLDVDADLDQPVDAGVGRRGERAGRPGRAEHVAAAAAGLVDRDVEVGVAVRHRHRAAAAAAAGTRRRGGRPAAGATRSVARSSPVSITYGRAHPARDRRAGEVHASVHGRASRGAPKVCRVAVTPQERTGSRHRSARDPRRRRRTRPWRSPGAPRTSCSAPSRATASSPTRGRARATRSTGSPTSPRSPRSTAGRPTRITRTGCTTTVRRSPTTR